MRLFGVLLAFVVSSCGISKQVEEAKTFSRCTFKLVKVERVMVGGVDVTHVRSLKDLSFKKMGKLIEAATRDQLPLELTVLLEASNPNEKKAALNALEWIVLADQNEISQGNLETRIEVPAQGSARFPVTVLSDLKRHGGSRDALLNLAFNLGGEGQKATDLLFKIKPTLVIAGVAVPYPGYVEIRREVTSQDGKDLRDELQKSHH